MAVLKAFPGITANIIIHNKPADEICDPDDVQVDHPDETVRDWQAGRTESNYIESVTRKNFAIEVSVGEPVGFKQVGKRKMQYTKIRFEITVDGVRAADAWCDRPWFNNNPNEKRWKQVFQGVEEGKGSSGTMKRFRFAKIETTDATNAQRAEVKRHKERSKKIGLIEIKVFSENYGTPGGAGYATSLGFMSANAAKVPEVAMKGEAKSHGTALERAENVQRGQLYRTEKKDGPDYPLVIFKFMYRSLEALKQLHIIPRTPESEELPLPPRSLSPSPHPPPQVQTPQPNIAVPAVNIAPVLMSGLAPDQLTEITNQITAQVTAQLTAYVAAQMGTLLSSLITQSSVAFATAGAGAVSIAPKVEIKPEKVSVKRERKADNGVGKRPAKRVKKTEEEIARETIVISDSEDD